MASTARTLSNLPLNESITLAMVQDILRAEGTIEPSAALNYNPTFRWVEFLVTDALPAALRNEFPLAISEEALRITALQHYPTPSPDTEPLHFILCVKPQQILPTLSDHTMVFRTEQDPLYIYLLVKDLLMRTLAWRQAVNHVQGEERPLSSLLDISADLLPYYLFITDKNSCVLAHSTKVEAPNDYYRNLSLSGYVHSPIESLRERLREGEATVILGDKPNTSDRLVFPLFIHHSFCGCLSLVCPATDVTQGMKDRLTSVGEIAASMLSRISSNHVSANIPQIQFFDMLLDGERFERMSLRRHLEDLGIPPDSWFKLILAEIDEGFEAAKASLLAMTFLSDSRVDTRCFFHNGVLLALQYAPTGPDLSHLTTEKILSSYDYTRFDIAYGVSDPFSDIVDLRHALSECTIALALRPAIQGQREVERSTLKRGDTYYFYEAVPYYFVDGAPKDEGFLHFVNQTSFLPIILEEDAVKGTNDFRLLWTYLLNERNATKTAQSMYVHRNTVLYRIAKIEERFRIDLNDSNMREKIASDYRTFFLSQGKYRWDTLRES